MELNISEIITRIAREKNVSMDIVIDALKTGLVTAARKYINEPVNIEAHIDREKGDIDVFVKQTTVEIVNDPETEILLEEALEKDPKLKLGEDLIIDLPVNEFGRAAIQASKQIVMQKVREAERSKIFNDYQERVGELITGSVQQVDRGNILVSLGRTEALLPWREQIKKEKYRQGDTIRALIINVEDSQNGAQVILSRSVPQFLVKLFELEVPEIYDGIVEIRAASRDPGSRSKIAVISRDERVDPVGACVGMKGNRVQAIVRELSNERIDIVTYNEELSIFIKRILAPAEVKKVHEIEDGRVVVIVAEESLAQAIGKSGQNIRLTSQLINRDIDIYGIEEWEKKTEEEKKEALAPKLDESEEGEAEETVEEEVEEIVETEEEEAAEEEAESEEEDEAETEGATEEEGGEEAETPVKG